MIVAFSVSPAAADASGSVSEAVAAAVRVVRESGLPHETSSMFTSIEGEWDEVMDVVKRAVAVVSEASPRTSLVCCSSGDCPETPCCLPSSSPANSPFGAVRAGNPSALSLPCYRAAAKHLER